MPTSIANLELRILHFTFYHKARRTNPVLWRVRRERTEHHSLAIICAQIWSQETRSRRKLCSDVVVAVHCQHPHKNEFHKELSLIFPGKQNNRERLRHTKNSVEHTTSRTRNLACGPVSRFLIIREPGYAAVPGEVLLVGIGLDVYDVYFTREHMKTQCVS